MQGPSNYWEMFVYNFLPPWNSELLICALPLNHSLWRSSIKCCLAMHGELCGCHPWVKWTGVMSLHKHIFRNAEPFSSLALHKMPGSTYAVLADLLHGTGGYDGIAMKEGRDRRGVCQRDVSWVIKAKHTFVLNCTIQAVLISTIIDGERHIGYCICPTPTLLKHSGVELPPVLQKERWAEFLLGFQLPG